MVLSRSFREELERMAEKNEEYSHMSLDNRMEELRRLKQRKKAFERATDVTDTRIMLLEFMPDVAEERVKRDKLAMGLLQELRTIGDISYRELDSRLKLPSIVLFTYLHRLETAQLVEMPRDMSYSTEIIKLTERGRTLQYAEQK